MTLRSDLLPILESVRAIPGELGLRPFTVTLRTRRWSGERPGLGESEDTDRSLLVGGQNPKVRPLSMREVFASGGLYQVGDFAIGPFAPELEAAALRPIEGITTEVFVRIEGPALPPAGLWCARVESAIGGAALSGRLVVRSLGVNAP